VKHFFLDTNVLLDFLANREPFAEHAAYLFQLSEEGKVKLYVSALSYNNLFYIIRKVKKSKEAAALLKELESMTETVDITKNIIHKSLQAGFADLEDAIQFYAAASNGKIDCIVTRNEKDFKKSSLPVLNPQQALAVMK
jgi:predicted nucleic acid-binding protein